MSTGYGALPPPNPRAPPPAADLDVDNDFDCIRATIADVGAAAQPEDLLYILSEPRFGDAPENMLSAIVD